MAPVYYCCVPGCRNNTAKNVNLKMFRFPRSQLRTEDWINIIRRPDLLSAKYINDNRICAAHFESNMRNKNRLIHLAYPNKNLPTELDLAELQRTSNITPSSSLVSDPNVEKISSSNEVKIKTEIDDVLQLEKEIAEMETSTNTLFKDCITSQKHIRRSKFMDTYESWQNEMKAKYQGYMYKKKYRLYCLNMYCKAPKAYPIFKTTFSLPSVRTLKNTKINLPPGINENFINLVGKHLLNIPKSKHIVICLEEIILNKHLYYDIRHDHIIGYHKINNYITNDLAHYSLIISIKGCLVKYQQIIAYCLVRYESYEPCEDHNISEWLDDIIRRLFLLDLHVCAVVSKQTTRLKSLAKFKGISSDNPKFKVDDKTIYYLYDFPQIIDAVKVSLMSNDFLYEDSVMDNKLVSWEHLLKFYQIDINRQTRLAPKLRSKHFELSHSDSTQLQLAKDVFSDTVVAAMTADITEGRLPAAARGSVDFYMKMNELINICNSSKINHPNKYKRAYAGKDFQTKSLLNALMVFQKVRVINPSTGQDNREEIKSIRGIIGSIKAILSMYEEYRPTGLKYLFTERLHVNSAEMLKELNQLRKRPQKENGCMTAIELKRSLSALALRHLITNSTRANCNMHLDSLLLVEEDDNDFLLLEEYIPNAPQSSPLAVNTDDYRFELPLVNTVQYVCSYLLKKCSEKHDCAAFKNYLDKIRNVDLNNALKDYEMFSPPQDFITYLNNYEKIFLNDYDKIIVKPKLGLKLYEMLQNYNNHNFKPCPCFPNTYLIKLFLRLRIYNIVKFSNLRFRQSSS